MVILTGCTLLAALLVLQQQREVSAKQVFEAARDQLLAERAHAESLGLEPDELALIQHDQAAITSVAPPSALPLLNESRIGFYRTARGEELQLWRRLQALEGQLTSESRVAAEEAYSQLGADLVRARQLGVEEDLLAPFAPVVTAARDQVGAATTVRDYRRVLSELKAALGKLKVLIADQEATNALIANYAAEAAAQDHGDPALARSVFSDTLAQLETDLQTARLFQMNVGRLDLKKKKVADQLAGAGTAGAVDQLTGTLMLLDQSVQQAMSATLPPKVLTLSLKEQTIRAYDHGKEVFWTYATTGRPGLETDPGNFKVYWKVSPWTMQSPWPKESPFWYPDSKVDMVMWFNGGAGIHNASWRAYYGPGTQFPHYDPLGANTGTHGCVNVPHANMVWLWNWTPTGTPVIVY